MSEQKTLNIKDLGEPLFASRSSDTFTYDGDKLLKVFHADVDPAMVDREELNTNEIFEKGATAKRVYEQILVEDNGETRHALLFNNVPGQTLIARGLSKPYTIPSIGKIMADQALLLHSKESDKIQSYKDLVRASMEQPHMSFLTEEDKAKVNARLDALPDRSNILHFDFHPDNILSDGKNICTFDFMTAATGDPAADVAATKVLLTEGEMIPGFNKAVATLLNVLKSAVFKQYLKRYKKKTGMTDEQIEPWAMMFRIVRMGIWGIPSERERLGREIKEELARE